MNSFLELVLPESATAYLLSLVPGANIEFGSLKRMLFDPHAFEKLDRLDAAVLRTAFASEEHKINWSQRDLLLQAVEEGDLQKYRERNQPPSQVRSDYLNNAEDQESFAQVVADGQDFTFEERTAHYRVRAKIKSCRGSDCKNEDEVALKVDVAKVGMANALATEYPKWQGCRVFVSHGVLLRNQLTFNH